MKKLNLLILLIAFFMVSGAAAQTPGRRTVPKRESPKTIDIKKNDPIITGQNKNLESVKLLKEKNFFKTAKVGSPKEKNGEVELKVVNNSFPNTSSTKKTNTTKRDFPTEYCVIENLDINVRARNFKEFPIDGIPGWLKPGIVMKGVDFISSSGKIEERYDRSPITLSTNLRGGTHTSLEVLNPRKKSNITSAENTLISQNANPPFANMIFKYYEVNSLEEIEFKLNGKYSGGFGAISGSMGLNYGNRKESNYYMIEFTQNMFQIEVDGIDANNLFVDPNVATEDYVYLSNVSYGRRGAIVIKSAKSASELGIRVALNANIGIHSAEVNSLYKSFSEDSNVQMELFFYGGSTVGAISAMKSAVRNKKPLDIFKYIESEPFNHKLAAPIGYELKNLNNEIVGLESNFKQDGYRTCFPKRDFKLKVTLTDIQNINGRDGGGSNPDDYGIQQYIVYKALGKSKNVISRDIRVFPERATGPVQVPNMHNVLISGDMKNQLHVRQGNEPVNRNRFINNSLVFNISFAEFMDPNAKFEIYTWLKEYTDGKDKVLANNTATFVKIKEVLEVLSGARTLKLSKPFYDTTIAKGVQFHDFGSGNLPLSNIQEERRPMILEGPIRIGNPGEKVAVWVQFELLD
ncbi:thiol-activated cytolysin family protein [Gelidibacter japonicus]|uniref:thiol-activated cytolysin family protein n=1 Tax=Gelidibacter japonicus TaxID=1962232 RepID=UPI0020222ACE|nr:thiol-activated cytolysin family protein [Gelidibacter japonicus]MCL8007173.1 thiol-activated cytolysin family protein [Gelidibacter japonicus]